MLPLGAWLLSDEAAGALDARLALLRGDLPAASRWLQSTPPSWHRQTMVPLDGPGPTRVRVLIALGTEAALAEARHLLADEMDEARRRHNVPRTVETLALQALACQAEGAIADALAALEQAIGLAAPGGFTRCFVELGPPMARLLRELDSRGGAGEHGRRVLAAFGAHSAVSVQVLPSRESLTDELIEPLTEREIEVLALLAGRLSNKEVARTLNISRQTVTKHTVNIYQKLQVHDRREAAQRGRALGLIPAPEPTDMVAVAPTYAGSKPA
jgi:LuxR family maltose regulon positive regulatory protein